MPVLALALASSGCFFGDLDYDGKACSADASCPEGWTCTDGACARNESPCAFRPNNVRIPWATPHTIRWQWDPPADVSGFGSYRLRIGTGTGPEDGNELPAITAFDNPELGFARIPRTSGDDLVRGTISRGLDPETPYWGRLEVTDDTGCVWSSPTLTTITQLYPPATNAPLVVFADAFVGWHQPESLVEEQVPETSFAGTAHLAWTAPSDVSSGDNMQLGLSLPLAELGPAVQDTAYIEAHVALDSQNHSYWSRVALSRGEGEDLHSLFEPFAVRADGQYQVVEIPLRALNPNDGVPLSSSDTLAKFMFGCSPFEPSTSLRMDEVRIRW